MATKDAKKAKSAKARGMNREERRMKAYRITFMVISVILILSWVLSLVYK